MLSYGISTIPEAFHFSFPLHFAIQIFTEYFKQRIRINVKVITKTRWQRFLHFRDFIIDNIVLHNREINKRKIIKDNYIFFFFFYVERKIRTRVMDR